MNLKKNCRILLLLLVPPLIINAAQFKTVPITEQGMVTAYVDVPAESECNIKLPKLPTAFCKGSNGMIFHLGSAGVIQGMVNSTQVVNYFQQQIAQSPQARIHRQYRLPEVSQHLLKIDAPLYYKQSQQISTVAMEIDDPTENESSILVIAVQGVPNNGAPVTMINIYGVSVPLTNKARFPNLNQALMQFIFSYRYDNRWVQSANASHVQFQNNLRAREGAFYSRQNQIHQNNMNALDSSFNSYMNRSSASDRAHQQTIDSIHERQQLIDPSTGARYEADGYNDYNYVNPNDPNMSVRTNDPLNNPNINNNQGENYNQLQDYNDGW